MAKTTATPAKKVSASAIKKARADIIGDMSSIEATNMQDACDDGSAIAKLLINGFPGYRAMDDKELVRRAKKLKAPHHNYDMEPLEAAIKVLEQAIAEQETPVRFKVGGTLRTGPQNKGKASKTA